MSTPSASQVVAEKLAANVTPDWQDCAALLAENAVLTTQRDELHIGMSSAIASLERKRMDAVNENAALREELENEKARGVHTCHEGCQRPLCVAGREKRALKAHVDMLRGALAHVRVAQKEYESALQGWMAAQEGSDRNSEPYNDAQDLHDRCFKAKLNAHVRANEAMEATKP